MYVSVIKNEAATAVLIVDSETSDVAVATLDAVIDELEEWGTHRDVTEYESDDVVLTVDGNRVSN